MMSPSRQVVVSSWPFGGYSARNRQVGVVGHFCTFLLVTPMAHTMGLWMPLLATHPTPLTNVSGSRYLSDLIGDLDDVSPRA